MSFTIYIDVCSKSLKNHNLEFFKICMGVNKVQGQSEAAFKQADAAKSFDIS